MRNVKTFIVRYLGDFFDDFMLNNFVCNSHLYEDANILKTNRKNLMHITFFGVRFFSDFFKVTRYLSKNAKQ